MSLPEIDLTPRPGDVYIQMGLRLVVIDVDDNDLHYVCRNGPYTGPNRRIPLESFQRGVMQGLITRGVNP